MSGKRTPVRPWQPMRRGHRIITDEFLAACAGNPDIDAAFAELDQAEVWLNDRYVVHVMRDENDAMHLSIRRKDRKAAHDWRHFQRIKNDIAGPDREAVELYPAESRLVDTANQYHLWVMPPDVKVPLGFSARVVSDEPDPRIPNTVQRPLAKDDDQ